MLTEGVVQLAGLAGPGDDRPWRVFISHTSELREFPEGTSYVAAAERAISAAGHAIVDMADFGASDQPPAHLCAERVRGCDVYVGILGTRYGSPVRDKPDVSYTELEFHTATESGLDRLVFLLDANAVDVGIPPSRLIDREFGDRQDAFRRQVQDGQLVTQSVASPAALRGLVECSLRDLADTRARAGRGIRREARPGDPVGRPLAEFAADPRRLDIHDAIDLGTDAAGRSFLPLYVPRPHDEDLATAVGRAAGGRSALAILIGDSSTGKTRACWEAVRALGEPWRLWYPVSPSPAEALLVGLHRVGPHTVIWLNEAQQYLKPTGTGEEAAAGLRDLLADGSRGPVLVLGTIWPGYWNELTANAKDGAHDPHALARALLVGSELLVPGEFSRADLDRLTGLADQDPRLGRALAEVKNAEVTQFLAGVPALVRRYRTAPAGAKALIHAAMDARRLGVRATTLPLAFLAGAAPGYPTDVEWQQLDEERWLDQALAYAGQPCRGVLGPLTNLKPRTPRPGQADSGYRLADYLEQLGSAERAAELPPSTFWDAARDALDPSDQVALARAAEARGLHRYGAHLFRDAIARGATRASSGLLTIIEAVDPAGAEQAGRWLIEHANWSDAGEVWFANYLLNGYGLSHLAGLLRLHAAAQVEPGDAASAARFLELIQDDHDALAVFLARDIWPGVAAGDLAEVGGLLRTLHALGATEHADALAARVAADLGPRDAWCAAVLGELGYASLQAEAVTRMAARADPGDIAGLSRFVDDLSGAQLAVHRESLIGRITDAGVVHAVALDEFELFRLLRMLAQLGAGDQLTELTARLRRHAAKAPPSWVAFLQMMSVELSLDDHLRSFLPPPPRPADLDLTDHETVRWIVRAWSETDDQAAIAEFDELLASRVLAAGPRPSAEHLTALLSLAGTGLLVRLAAEMPLGHPGLAAWLLRELRQRDGDPGLEALLARSPAGAADLHGADAGDVASLMAELRVLGRDDQIAILVGRQPASRVSAASARGSEVLLRELTKAGARAQVLTLAARAAAGAALDNVWGVCTLLSAFAVADAADALAVLSARAADQVSLVDASDTNILLKTFRELSLTPAIAQLASRDPAAHIELGDSRLDRQVWPALLTALKLAGYDDQVTTMATRMAAHADLSLPGTTAAWADAMREAGAHDQALRLARRAADSGAFGLFLTIDRDAAQRFRYGREPDRTPSPPWTWADLEAD